MPGAGPVVAEGQGDLAPGLIGARFGDRRLAAVDCPQPSPETWFTGVGAGTRHNSVLELTNPDAGPAVADVTVLARAGEVTASDLRGVTVPGNESVRLDLSKAVPRRTELALRVVVSRGRLAPTVLDELPKLGSSPLTQDWLPPQPAPARRNVLLGLPAGGGTNSLAVSNPGEDEVRASVKILTADAAFAPQGLEAIRVPPGTVQTVDLSAAGAQGRQGRCHRRRGHLDRAGDGRDPVVHRRRPVAGRTRAPRRRADVAGRSSRPARRCCWPMPPRSESSRSRPGTTPARS